MSPAHITQEQADEYAIGSLDPAMERVVALHLAECTTCREIARDSERLASRIGLSTPLMPPPARLRRRVFNSAGISRPSLALRVIRYARTAGGLAAAVIAVLAFTAMLGVRGQIGGLQDQNIELLRQLDEVRSTRVEVAALTAKVSEQEHEAALNEADARQDRELTVALLSPDSQTAKVFSVDENTAAVGRLVWDDSQKRLWFIATNLERLKGGKTYQIWVNNGGHYITLGTFNPDTTGFIRYTTAVAEGLTNYESIIVTIEKAGGSREKTSSAPVFVANLEALRR